MTALDTAALAYATATSPRERHTAARETVDRAAVFVRVVVRRLPRPETVLASQEDLEASGMLGIARALAGYDPARGSFSTFAFAHVRGEAVDLLRQTDSLSRDRRRASAEMAWAADGLRQALGRDPRSCEIAARLGTSVDRVDGLRREALSRLSRSLDSAPEGVPVLLDVLADGACDPADGRAETASDLAHLARLVRRLRPREQLVLVMLYNEGRTLNDVAERLCVTEARVCQIRVELLRRLRAWWV